MGTAGKKAHVVKRVLPGSIAEELGLAPGDKILAVNDAEIEDIFDYQYLTQDTYIEVLAEKPDGEQWLLEVDKEADEDLGIEFENGLMDEYRRCRNRCVFCFIDQMPPGMRETLYFKDDDSRLSFLQGNYVTLTNMSDHDIERICRYRLSPINISFHTMNPELRCRMLNNRFAGEALKKVDVLNEAGIRMNGQIVLCKGLNDGAELDFSIRKLMKYVPNLESLSVVPVGLTRFREGLYPLEPFGREDAVQVIETIERYQRECMEHYGTHFVHAGDEWYLLAERELPEAGRYDGYLQLENGVGMMRLLMDEFEEALADRRKRDGAAKKGTDAGRDGSAEKGAAADGCRSGEKGTDTDGDGPAEKSVEADRCSAAGRDAESSVATELSMATGLLAYPYIKEMAERMEEAYPRLKIHVHPVTNHFFGEHITVSGLLTGQDILAQLSGKPLGSRLLLPENVLRSGEDVFLDDLHVGDLEKALQVPVNIVKSSGHDFVETILETEVRTDT